jgi:ATP-dependent Clp protease protease subunit
MAQFFASEEFAKFTKEYFETHRIIHISGTIDMDMADAFRTLMFYLDSKDNERPIKLYINSPGGMIYPLLGMLDVIDKVKSPVYTYANGLAASAAAILLTYGDKRYATRYSTIMTHQPLIGCVGGQTEDIKIHAKEMDRLRLLLAEIVSYKTGLSIEKILTDLFDRDTYITPEKAKELGIIDEIVEPEKNKGIDSKLKEITQKFDPFNRKLW